MAKKRSRFRSKSVSGIVGAILLGLGCLWLGWLLLGQHNSSPGSFIWPSSSGANTNPSSNAPLPQLSAEGITLGHAGQNPTLSQQQAVLLANQLEPDAANNAKNINARYVLLTHASLNNIPVWMVSYQRIPIEPNNASVDPVPSTRSYHDLYVFVDANTGKEVLSVWV